MALDLPFQWKYRVPPQLHIDVANTYSSAHIGQVGGKMAPYITDLIDNLIQCHDIRGDADRYTSDENHVATA